MLRRNQVYLLYVGSDNLTLIQKLIEEGFLLSRVASLNAGIDVLHRCEKEGSPLPDIILTDSGPENADYFTSLVLKIKGDVKWQDIPVIVISNYPSEVLKRKALRMKVADYYEYPFELGKLIYRIQDLKEMSTYRKTDSTVSSFPMNPRMPKRKRIFDVVIGSILLVLFTPFFLFISIWIAFFDKIPVFARTKKVGFGYKIFDSFSFNITSFVEDAEDQELVGLSELKAQEELVAAGIKEVPTILVADERLHIEDELLAAFQFDSKKITGHAFQQGELSRSGKWLFRSKLYRLPQLINVIKGDMSLVGNKALALLDAEQLTSDEWALRFMAPAGMTGLWQVESRLKGKTSLEDLKALDLYYALNHNLWMDINILLKTIPAWIKRRK